MRHTYLDFFFLKKSFSEIEMDLDTWQSEQQVAWPFDCLPLSIPLNFAAA